MDVEGVLLSVEEVASRFDVDGSTIRRALYRNDFPNAFKIGRLWKIPEADLKVFVEKQKRKRQVAASAVES